MTAFTVILLRISLILVLSVQLNEGRPKENCGCSNASSKRMCGKDGITYPNRCLMECAGVAIRFRGKCSDFRSSGGRLLKKKPGCVCPKTLRYVCGTDGVTYTNKCEADCIKAPIKSTGKCPGFNPFGPGSDEEGGSVSVRKLTNKPKACVCSKMENKVCGSDAKTYVNACEAECLGLTIQSLGSCPEGAQPGAAPMNDDDDDDKSCVCPRTLRLVCGTDGKTYSNDCEAACVGAKVASQGRCKPKEAPAVTKTNTASKSTPKACTDCSSELALVCGTNGKTYNNDCLATCAGTKVKSKGECA